MRWYDIINEKIENRLSKLSIDEKSINIAFYSILAYLLVVCVLIMYSLAYAGSYDPKTLFDSKNFSFSYAGSPIYTFLHSKNYSIGISSLKNSTVDLKLWEGSYIKLYPMDAINLTFSNGTIIQVNDASIITSPGTITDINILLIEGDDLYYSMIFHFKDANDRPINTDNDLLKIIKKGNDQYLILANFSSGSYKNFTVKERYSFPIVIDLDKNNEISIDGILINDVIKIDYIGHIDINTTDRLDMSIPVSSMSGANCYNITLKHSDGTLDVRHNEYKCNPADDIMIFPTNDENSAFVQVSDGRIIAYGRADTLNFRERQFGNPITVIIKEGNFALFTGIIMSFLTIVIGRLILQYKKR